jgi:hypothetical protein
MSRSRGESETDDRGSPADQARASELSDCPHSAIVREREQLAMTLHMSRAAASLDLGEAIKQVGQCFQTSRWRWDYTSLFLHEPSQRALRQDEFVSVGRRSGRRVPALRRLKSLMPIFAFAKAAIREARREG